MIVLHCRKPRFLSLPVSPPIYRSKSAKFQLCTTAQSIIIFMRTAIPCLCFVCIFSKSGGRNNAKYAFQYTFNNNTRPVARLFYGEVRSKKETDQMRPEGQVSWGGGRNFGCLRLNCAASLQFGGGGPTSNALTCAT